MNNGCKPPVIMGHEIYQNHYTILALPYPSGMDKELSQHDIRLAYRLALLRSHPDKSQCTKGILIDTQTYTIDQITLAFKTLIDPESRSKHDQILKLHMKESPKAKAQRSHPGLDTIDLDDLISNEEEGIWYTSCRCGHEQGFMITEEELGRNVEHGEVITGCRGCSLWMRIVFALSEEG